MSAVGHFKFCGEKKRCSREEKDLDAAAAEEWPGGSPFQCKVCTLHVVRANMTVYTFTTEVPWIRHHSYNNRLFRESGKKRSRAREQKELKLLLVLYKEIACSKKTAA